MFNFNPANPLGAAFAAWERSKQQARWVANHPSQAAHAGPWNKRNLKSFPNPNLGARGRAKNDTPPNSD